MTELSGYLQRMLDTSTIYSSGCDWPKHFLLKIMVRKKKQYSHVVHWTTTYFTRNWS